jgi:peptide/nickel transport system ATP-binding protein
MTEGTLIEVEDLHVRFDLFEGVSHVLNGVGITIRNGERIGLVGESGCGKSLLARCILGLLEQKNIRIDGAIRYHGRDLFAMRGSEWRDLRGRRITMIFQDPTAALNPVFTVADQMVEVIQRGGNRKRKREECLDIAREALRRVFIDDPDRVLRSYPFQLSGGMAQRVIITMALANDPELVLADEPGTSLDVTVQEQTLRLMATLTQEAGAAVLLIAHNLGVVREFCERLYVMYGGVIVEEGSVEEIFNEPLHPYTQALFGAVPRLWGGDLPKAIAGMVPDYTQAPEGCRFHPRCPHAKPECQSTPPWVKLGEGRGVRCVLFEGAERSTVHA